jgi:calcineurin-like phosphoesterase family protein
MRSAGVRTRRAARRGKRRPVTFLVIVRIPDPGISSLVASFPDIVHVRSGESREPHVTLFGPFRLLPGSSEYSLLDRIREAAEGIPAVSCRIGGLLQLRGRKGAAIALSLAPDVNLVSLYHRLIRSVFPETGWSTWIDRPPGSRIFHLSLRISISRSEAPDVWRQIRDQPDAAGMIRDQEKRQGLRPGGCNAPLTLFRVAVMRRGALWREFDLARGLWLSRTEAFNPGLWTTTRREFRKRAGLQREVPVVRDRDSPVRFVISDLHLGHRNIIRYCRRPFSSALEMDAVLLDNWNFTVRPGDEVLYLGDLRYGQGAPPATHFLERLHGRVTCIIGNHDDPLPGAVPSVNITHDRVSFLCIHDPELVPEDYQGWVIHGHVHNNDLDRYPFINAETRTINVSAELVDYTPVSLDEIAAFIRAIPPGEKVMTLKEARECLTPGK